MTEEAQSMPPVLFVGEKDSKRLLEVYVRRSLSLNDGSQCPPRRERRPSKWVTPVLRDKRERRHSSDSSLNVKPLSADVNLGKDEAFSEPEPDSSVQFGKETKSKQWFKKIDILKRNEGSSTNRFSDEKPSGKPRKWILHFDKEKQDFTPRESFKPDSGDVYSVGGITLNDLVESSTEMKKRKDTKKIKKPSLWKTFIGLFSRGDTDKQEEQDGDDERTEDHYIPSEPSTPPPSCLPMINSDAVHLRQNKSLKKRRPPKRLSINRHSTDVGLDKTNVRPCTLDLSRDAQQSMVESM